MALALTLSLNAITLSFSFEISDGRFRLHWLTLPGQPIAVAVLGLLSVALWIAYAHTSRRITTEILG
jgi:hypothetical protein